MSSTISKQLAKDDGVYRLDLIPTEISASGIPPDLDFEVFFNPLKHQEWFQTLLFSLTWSDGAYRPIGLAMAIDTPVSIKPQFSVNAAEFLTPYALREYGSSEKSLSFRRDVLILGLRKALTVDALQS